MLSYKDSLKVLKKTRALLEGHFVLSSGLHSNKYIQCAKLLSFPNQALKICNSLSKKIVKSQWFFFMGLCQIWLEQNLWQFKSFVENKN